MIAHLSYPEGMIPESRAFGRQLTMQGAPAWLTIPLILPPPLSPKAKTTITNRIKINRTKSKPNQTTQKSVKLKAINKTAPLSHSPHIATTAHQKQKQQ